MKRRVTISLLWALLCVPSARAAENTQRLLDLDFHEDTPCLENSGGSLDDSGDFSTDGGVMGTLAAQGGACHGLSRWVAVSAQNLRYDCRPGSGQTSFAGYARTLRRAHLLWERGCTQRLTVEGYCNLRDVCRRRTTDARQLVVGLQTTGTLNRGLESLLATLGTQSDYERTAANSYTVLSYAMNEIDHGRYPIIYRFARLDARFGHMLVLHGYDKRVVAASASYPETWMVTLHFYDPSNPSTPATQNAVMYPTRRSAVGRDNADSLTDFHLPWRRAQRMARAECDRLVRSWEVSDSAARDQAPF